MPTALVVDDEPGVREVIRLTLHRYRFEVLEATDMTESYSVALDHSARIDILIVNDGLDDGFGEQAINRIAATHPEIKVLRYSGYAREHLLETGALNPADAFLRKPFRAGELTEKVREVLGWLPERRRTASGGD